MRNPTLVLENLAKHSEEEHYQYEKLYRNLYNVDFYRTAYEKISAKKRILPEDIDGFSLQRITTFIESLKDESYQPNAVKPICIPKKNDKPLSVHDKLVQEIVRSILEAIYEGSFSENSHAFRKGKSCHTALLQIKRNFPGVKWWVVGTITDLFRTMDHEVLINILKKRIKDERFLRLVSKFLKAGYLEDVGFQHHYSGTVQGGIISSILSNIYLHELDQYMLSFQQKLSNDNEMQKDDTRMKYVRYGDQFVIGITGPKEMAEEIKNNLTEFLGKNLRLKLSQEKTLITHWKKTIRFLGYDLFMDNHVRLSLPTVIVEQFLFKNRYMKIIDGKWKAIHSPKLLNYDDIEIVRAYNKEYRRLYQYYQYAFNVKEKLSSAHFIFQQSFQKTLAGKYRTKVSKLTRMKTETGNKKYFRNGIWGITFKDQHGIERFVPIFQKEQLVFVNEC